MPHVATQADMTLCFTGLLSPHDFVPMPPSPPVPPPMSAPVAFAMELPVNVAWAPGAGAGTHALSRDVFVQGQVVALQGHDCGPMIPHVQLNPAPNNLLTVLHTLHSARSALFCARSVEIDGQPVACMEATSWPPSPMAVCADPTSLPLGSAVTACLNTVIVGMSLTDFFVGLVGFAVAATCDVLLWRVSGGADALHRKGDALAAGWAAGGDAWQRALFDQILEGVIVPDAKDAFLRAGIAAVSGVVPHLLAGDDLEVPLSARIGVPLLGFTLTGTVTRSADGGLARSVSGTAGVGIGTLNWTSTSDEDRVGARSVSGRSWTTTRDRDGAVTVTNDQVDVRPGRRDDYLDASVTFDSEGGVVVATPQVAAGTLPAGL